MTYDELRLALHGYAHRQDPETVANEPNALEFARLAVGRRFHPPEALAAFGGVLSGTGIALPADFGMLEAAVAPSGRELEYRSLRAYQAEQLKTDRPMFVFTLTGTALLAPVALGSVNCTYYQAPPVIAGTATSWLSVTYADIWLQAALAEQWRFVEDFDAAMATDSYWIGLAASAMESARERLQSGGAIRMKGR